MKDIVVSLVDEVRKELENDILPFWMTRMVDNENGGFYGQITGEDVLCPKASKGAILNARILWTFSSAYRILKNDLYLKMASRAKEYLIGKFYDEQYGGIFWELDFKGNPADTKKQIYAIGFAIYGLSEYVRATGDKEALEYAVKLFDVIERYSFDSVRGGYFEAFTRDWKPIEDMRLSEKDENESKTMNTHLHVLEAYTNLYRVWKNELLKKQLAHLIDVFLHRILDKDTNHLNLFFQLISRRYEKKSTIITSNKNLSKWSELFKDPMLTNAILDRLLHHSKVVQMIGPSYRTKNLILADKESEEQSQYWLYFTGHFDKFCIDIIK